MVSASDVIKEFGETFGEEASVLVQAPGRVNIIGEHTDYNEGFVLPAAIDRHIVIAGSRRDDGLFFLRSMDYGLTATFSISDIGYDEENSWSNYFRGVVASLKRRGFELAGANAVVSGDIPQGAGLSSSAAFEVAAAFFFKQLLNLELSTLELVELCQEAENKFVGVNCGIMDQFVSAYGKKGHAVFLDCRSLEHELVPLPENVAIVVFDTKIKRALARSEYNLRRAQCEQGVRALAAHLVGIRALRDVSLEELARYEHLLDDAIRKRCRHVASENKRVLDAVAALKGGDLISLKKLMLDSHLSLRDDYQVSCRELDVLVDLAYEHDGCLGARMTGAGFGGCTVNLVNAEAASQFIEYVSRGYQSALGVGPRAYIFSASDGAGPIRRCDQTNAGG